MSYTVRFESQGAYAELDIWDDGTKATLSALNSQFKRRGAGTKVLELALAYADKMSMEMVLFVSPFGEDMGMDKAQLRAYYMSYDFTWEGDGVMKRKTQGTRVLESDGFEEVVWSDLIMKCSGINPPYYSILDEQGACNYIARYGLWTDEIFFYENLPEEIFSSWVSLNDFLGLGDGV